MSEARAKIKEVQRSLVLRGDSSREFCPLQECGPSFILRNEEILTVGVSHKRRVICYPLFFGSEIKRGAPRCLGESFDVTEEGLR